MTSLVTQTRDLLAEVVCALGRDGGELSPSLYDTAQVLRLFPRPDSALATAGWLVSQQDADGGWGSAAAPLARDVSTLAVVLALHDAGPDIFQQAIAAGLRFLHQSAPQWAPPLGDDIPGSVELVLPTLLQAAYDQQLPIDGAPYQALVALQHERSARIARLPAIAGTTAGHAWEGWGTVASVAVLDRAGSVGHSPAATAAWLRAATAGLPAAPRALAQRYLDAAAQATGSSIAGLVPTAWPIDRFEQCFGLYALLLAGLLDDPDLAPVVQPQVAALHAALTPHGVGMSDAFQPDGDDTAVAVAVLAASGCAFDATVLDQFTHDDHYHTWPYELQPSLSVTAHAVHARALLGLASPDSVGYLLQRQQPAGSWTGDKWHASWVYATSHVLFALDGQISAAVMQHALGAFLRGQHADGGWGMLGSTAEETAYALLALYQFGHYLGGASRVERACVRGHAWLEACAFAPALPALWLGKEPYVPHRIVQVFILAALLRGESRGHTTNARSVHAAA